MRRARDLVVGIAVDGPVAIATAAADFDAGALVGAPGEADIPEHALLIVAQQPRQVVVALKMPAIGEHGATVAVDEELLLALLQLLVADAAEQRDRERDRHGHIAAHPLVLETRVEEALLVAQIGAADPPAERQRTGALGDARLDGVAVAVGEVVEARLAGAQDQRAVAAVGMDVAEMIGGHEVEVADAPGNGRADPGAVELLGVAAIADEEVRARLLEAGARPRGDRRGVHRRA